MKNPTKITSKTSLSTLSSASLYLSMSLLMAPFAWSSEIAEAAGAAPVEEQVELAGPVTIAVDPRFGDLDTLFTNLTNGTPQAWAASVTENFGTLQDAPLTYEDAQAAFKTTATFMHDFSTFIERGLEKGQALSALGELVMNTYNTIEGHLATAGLSLTPGAPLSIDGVEAGSEQELDLLKLRNKARLGALAKFLIQNSTYEGTVYSTPEAIEPYETYMQKVWVKFEGMTAGLFDHPKITTEEKSTLLKTHTSLMTLATQWSQKRLGHYRAIIQQAESNLPALEIWATQLAPKTQGLEETAQLSQGAFNAEANILADFQKTKLTPLMAINSFKNFAQSLLPETTIDLFKDGTTSEFLSALQAKYTQDNNAQNLQYTALMQSALEGTEQTPLDFVTAFIAQKQAEEDAFQAEHGDIPAALAMLDANFFVAKTIYEGDQHALAALTQKQADIQGKIEAYQGALESKPKIALFLEASNRYLTAAKESSELQNRIGGKLEA